MKSVRLLLVACLLAGLPLLAGCLQQGGGSGSAGPGGDTNAAAPGAPEAVYDTTSIQVSVADGADTSAPGALFGGSFADVTRVVVTVSGEDKFGVPQAELAVAELTLESDGVWRATIAGLPVDPLLTFHAVGFDAAGAEIFSGISEQVLTGGGGDLVVIAMAPSDDGVAILFPVIESITLPAEIINESTVAAAVALRGSPGETLAYSFSPAGIFFDPRDGTIPMAGSGTGTLNTTYHAPTAVGSYAHSLRVTNSQGNSVETDFTSLVVYDVTDPDVVITFAPVITALLGKRTDGDVTWTVTVADDKDLSELSYAWSFAQGEGTAGAAFSTADANPGVLSGYDETVGGEVTLTVTDGDGLSTTVTFTLNAGQFPDEVVVNPGGNPFGYAGLDGTFGDTWEMLAAPSGYLAALVSFHRAGQPYLYDFYSTPQRYDIAADSWTFLALPPFASSSAWTDGAVDAEGLWVPRNGNMYRFTFADETWTLVTAGIPNATLDYSAAVYDGQGLVWYHVPGELVRYDPATGEVATFPHAAFTTYETRVGYDPIGNRIAFAGFQNDRFMVFDIAAETFAVGTPSPGGAVKDNSCQDRSGHMYVGDDTYTQMYRYDIAGDTWTALPPNPFHHDNGSTCVVSQDGYLYLGAYNLFARLPLGVSP